MKKEILLLTSLTVLAVILFFVLPVSNESVKDSDVDEILTENITDESLIDDGKIKLTFDVIRITPQGDAVMAGRSAFEAKRMKISDVAIPSSNKENAIS